MKRIRSLGLGLSILLCAQFVGAVASAAAPVNCACDTLDKGGYCIWPLSKNVEGAMKFGPIATRKCAGETPAKPHTTYTGAASYDLVVQSHGSCDETGLFLPIGGHFHAVGTRSLRNDGFAHFRGNFSFTGPSGEPMWQGRLELMERLGTHHVAPSPTVGACEACDRKRHFEGWLYGCGVKWQRRHIRALIVGDFVPNGLNSQRIRATVDGALMHL